MRFGGPIQEKTAGPEEWVRANQRLGYSAAYCPLDETASDVTVAAYVTAARAADIVIAEVGAWSNPMSPDAAVRRQAITLCQKRLDLAERVGARCCVNIAGSRGTRWDGPHAENLTPACFDLLVQTVREIIDAVRPRRTCYTLEPMPWMYPDSADSYLRLLAAIDRPAFAVHYDPVNMVNSPTRFYANAADIRDFVAKLGPHIRSVHAKDIVLADKLTVHLDEAVPGQGGLDYVTLLREVSRLDADLPVLMEHLQTAEQYAQAAAHIRAQAVAAGVTLK